MVGNIVTGTSVFAPAAMLGELSGGLDVSVRTAALLVTFGAVVLCIGSPLTAWLTSRIERRALLTGTLAVMALTNAASAFAPDFTSLLVIRLIMLAIGALYTPQAAGTGAMIVPVEKRGSTIAYIFLGWSVAAAVGLPLITFIASRYGWREAYGGIGVIGCLSCVFLAWRLPGGLVGAPVDLKTWAALGRNPMIALLLLITTLQMSGQFVVFTFMGPLLSKLTQAGPDAIGLVFAFYGVFGFIGIVVATRIVDFLGSLQNLVAVHFAAAGGRHRMGAQRRHLFVDGGIGRDLGPRLCIDQLDAAGPAGRRGAGVGAGIGIPQYIGALCRTGHWFGDWRCVIRAESDYTAPATCRWGLSRWRY